MGSDRSNGPLLELHQRQQAKCASDRVRVDDRLVWNRSGQHRGDEDRSRCSERATGESSIDPDHQRNEEERSDEEEIALLDAVAYRIRRIRRDRYGEPEHDRHRDGCKDAKRASPLGVKQPGMDEEKGGKREDAEVQVHLREVVDKPPSNWTEVVVELADAAVRPEQSVQVPPSSPFDEYESK